MKIYTITCHDVYNHGASLQAYALMRYFEKQNHNVEIIDYKPDYLSNHYNMFSIDNPKWEKNFITKFIYLILKMPSRILALKRKKAFDIFKQNNLKLTSKRYNSNDELKENLPLADAYICGSDQIWNCLRQNGKDKAFYLNFAPNNKIKASYAASFATDSISKEYESFIKENVDRLNGVAVRELSGVNILNNLGVKNVVNVLDPVFLLGKEEWNNVGKEKLKEKYLLVYDFDKNYFIERVAKDIAKEKGYKIYTINEHKLGYEDKSFKYSGPEVFVSLIRNAEFVISNSFHAVAFSLIYEKQVAIVNRAEDINTRMRDLLSLVNLKDRLINDKNYNLDKLLNKIDYKVVQEKLNKNIDISKSYLEKIIFIKN